MQLELTEHQRLTKDAARKFAAQHLAPFAAGWDKKEEFPAQALQKLGEAGFLAMLVPEDEGGTGAGAVAYALAIMELAEGCPATTVTMSVTNMVADVISRFGTPEQKQRYLPKFADGSFLCASFSLSEPGAGSDAAGLKARADQDGDDYVLNGEKAWVSHGEEASLYLIMAQVDQGGGKLKPTAFLVERGAKGLSVGRREEKMGLRASHTCGLVLDGLRVPKTAILGGEGNGLKVALTALDGGRIGVGAQAIGIARAALQASLKYAKDRQTFGKAIGEFQAIQWKLANMATELDAATLLVLRAAEMREKKQPCTKEAAMAKLFATDAAYRVCNEAVQIHGGYGYIGEFPVERHFRDVRVTQIYEGANEIQRIVIARAVLS
ncbi:MAG: acyl-CoA dehydrogenase family protein [Deltaproteobacteria bacterium]|nr:acyl-CoA dehydrogenase family protein [Deltaproteobacteria bacterium]